jgi:uncharacterized protein YdaU (DUF1376 family)
MCLSYEVSLLTPAAFGMLMRLLHHFWRTDGRPFPVSDTALSTIARAPRQNWALHKRQILPLLPILTPKIAEARETRRLKIANLRECGRRSAELGRARRLEQSALEVREKTALASVLPSRTATQSRINVERRTERQTQTKFVETHF